MSTTPRTDAQAYDIGGYQHPQGAIVPTSFARELETEVELLKGDIRFKDESYKRMTETANHFDRENQRLRTTLAYCERQIREVWNATDTYQQVHREWAMGEINKALDERP